MPRRVVGPYGTVLVHYQPVQPLHCKKWFINGFLTLRRQIKVLEAKKRLCWIKNIGNKQLAKYKLDYSHIE